MLCTRRLQMFGSVVEPVATKANDPGGVVVDGITFTLRVSELSTIVQHPGHGQL